MSNELVKGSGETILLVDDDKSVLESYKLMIEFLGYKDIPAESGEKAISIYRENLVSSQDPDQPPKSGIDLVILDMIMPGMEGPEVFYRLKELNPDVKVLIASGYQTSEDVRKLSEDGAKGFIQKPFNMAGLSAKIREILDNENIKPAPTQANDYSNGSVY